MQDKRKKDLEAKKRKLEELRKKRRNRKAAAAGTGTASASQRGQDLVKDALQYVNDLRNKEKARALSPPEEKKVEAAPAPVAAVAVGGEAYTGSLEHHASVGTVSIAPLSKASYTKKIQVEAADLATEIGIIKPNSTEEFIDQVKAAFGGPDLHVWPPKDKAVAAEETKEDEQDQKGEEKDEEAASEPEEDNLPPIMDPKEAQTVMKTAEFKDFWDWGSRLMERAVAAGEDQNIFLNYGATDANDNIDEGTKELLFFKKRFRHEETTIGRAITSVAFSRPHKELFLASYAEPINYTADIPDGTVHVWNKLLTDRPEFTFQSQSMVTVADFHPSNPKLIVGATVSGAVVVWDMRAKKKTPQTRTPFHTSHQRAIYAMQLVPTHQKVMNIHSVCNEGKLMVWRDDILESPTHSYKLTPEGELAQAREELLTTCFSAYTKNQSQVVYGSSDGYIYKGAIYQMASDKDNIQVKSTRAHHGPITAVEFHPDTKRGSKAIVDTYLSSSFDWTVKLWDHRTDRMLHCFEHMQDYVHDVQWSPVHPAVFACCDGLGSINIYNLAKDWEQPVVDYKVQQTYRTATNTESRKGQDYAITRLTWSLDGRQLLCGDANGDLYMHDVNQSLWEASDQDLNTFEQFLRSK